MMVGTERCESSEASIGAGERAGEFATIDRKVSTNACQTPIGASGEAAETLGAASMPRAGFGFDEDGPASAGVNPLEPAAHDLDSEGDTQTGAARALSGAGLATGAMRLCVGSCGLFPAAFVSP